MKSRSQKTNIIHIRTSPDLAQGHTPILDTLAVFSFVSWITQQQFNYSTIFFSQHTRPSDRSSQHLLQNLYDLLHFLRRVIMHERDTHRSVVEVDFGAKIFDEGICVEMSVANSDLRNVTRPTPVSISSSHTTRMRYPQKRREKDQKKNAPRPSYQTPPPHPYS